MCIIVRFVKGIGDRIYGNRNCKRYGWNDEAKVLD